MQPVLWTAKPSRSKKKTTEIENRKKQHEKLVSGNFKNDTKHSLTLKPKFSTTLSSSFEFCTRKKNNKKNEIIKEEN